MTTLAEKRAEREERERERIRRSILLLTSQVRQPLRRKVRP